jgi:hypothetical protein
VKGFRKTLILMILMIEAKIIPPLDWDKGGGTHAFTSNYF